MVPDNFVKIKKHYPLGFSMSGESENCFPTHVCETSKAEPFCVPLAAEMVDRVNADKVEKVVPLINI